MGVLNSPMHPGEVLRELYLDPLGMGAAALAGRLGVPRGRVARLARGEAALDAGMCLRLAKFFVTTPEYWMNLQRSWDVARARESVDTSGIRPLESA